MKNFKKVIALVAVLALTLSTVALGATYSDVPEDSAYSIAVESLGKLGIVTGYEDGTYGPEKAVTRAEMAALIARIQGYEETAQNSSTTAFSDVPSTHWASGYVALASDMGIVNGYGDGKFGPEDSVKFEQAVTMIMRTLGYEPYAKANGAYPTGYLAAAQRYGVLKNVSNAKAGTEANRGTIAQLLYNAIDTPLMAQDSWSTSGEIGYTIYDGGLTASGRREYRTLMSDNLGVIKIKGIVKGDSVVNFNDSTTYTSKEDAFVNIKVTDNFNNSSDNYFKTDGNLDASSGNGKWDAAETSAILVGDTTIADALGYQVIAYLIKDEATDKYVVVSYALDSNVNDVVEFTLDQYKGYTAGKVEYYKNATDENETKVIFADVADTVIINNKGGYQASTMHSLINNKTLSGKVTLINNDTQTGYDLAIVEVGTSLVVDEVTSNRVSFKEGVDDVFGTNFKRIAIDPEDENKLVVFTKDGEVIDYTELVEWDVVTLINNANANGVIYAEVINAPVAGQVVSTKASDSSADSYGYKVGDKYYDIAKDAYDCAGLEIGSAGTFFVDKYGKIVAFNEDSSVIGATANYAWIMKGAIDPSALSDNTLQFKVLTADGIDIVDAASKVTIDGTVYEDGTADDMSDALTALGAAPVTGVIDQLVKYTVNASGNINDIKTTSYNAKFSFVSDGSTVAGTTGTYKAFDADSLKIGSTLVDEDATVFILRGDNSFVGTLADLEDKEAYAYKAYLDTRGDDANLVVITAGYDSVGASSSIAVITEVSTTKNDDEENVLALSYYQDNELKENILTSADVKNTVSGLTAGDIVKVKVSSTGVITAATKIVDFNDPVRAADGTISNSTPINGAAGGTDEKYYYGYASSYTKATKNVTVGGSNHRLTRADNVYVIDASKRAAIVEIGSASDFDYNENILSAHNKYADYLFIRTYDNAPADVVIIKNIVKDTDVNAATDAQYIALKTNEYNTAAADLATVCSDNSITASGAFAQGVVDAFTAARDAYIAAKAAILDVKDDFVLNATAELQAAYELTVTP